MSIFEKGRFEIWNAAQHPYKHPSSDFAYSHDTLPGVTNLESALDWILAVLYPNTMPSVATVGDLPLIGNNINDFRVVLDDGDGKIASYRWEQREGDVAPKWYKIYDIDWGVDAVLNQFHLKTLDIYVSKKGYDDRDSDGVIIAGTLAGQTIYGGASPNTNLTLYANSGDGTGPATGYVQVGDNFRPITDNAFDLGTAALKFKNLYLSGAIAVASVVAGTLTLAAGSITDSSGAITFDNENLSTSGTLASGTHTIGNMVIATGSITNTSGGISFDNENLNTTGTFASGTHTIGNLVLASATITHSSGTISFDNEHLTTTGDISGGTGTFTQVNSDNLRLDGNTLSSTDANGNIILLANGVGIVDIQSAMTTIGQTITGTLAVTGIINIDNLRLDGNTLSSTNADGNLILNPNGAGLIQMAAAAYPSTSASWDFGKTGNLWNYIWLAAGIKDGTNTLPIATLMSFRDALVGASNGMTLFYVDGLWTASLPDSEVDHGTISGLSDDDHTQYTLLAGRSGGQTLTGGTGSGDDLTLQSTSHGTKGNIFLSSDTVPTTNATFSGVWSGTDLGDATHYFKDVYSKGVFKNFRLENYTSGTLPAPSTQNIGRLVYSTDNNKIYADTGTSFIVAGVGKYVADQSLDGVATTTNVNVSANITDARNCIIQLLDNSNDFERVNCQILATSASNVRIVTNPALPAGSYRLIVLE